MSQYVDVKKEQGCAVITIVRPNALNALNSLVIDQLQEAVLDLENDRSLRVGILTGGGEKSFVAGADIKEINSLDKESALSFARKGQEVFARIESLPFPLIGAVNGFALGGGLELALSCDFIYAAESAKFGLPECTLGLIPGFGGTVRLARKIGPGRAKEMTFVGGMISAKEAADIGLVNKVYPDESLMGEVIGLAKTLHKRAPLALRGIKKSINESYGRPIPEAMAFEAQEFARLFTTWDVKEGTAAFIEKRKPDFKGE